MNAVTDADPYAPMISTIFTTSLVAIEVLSPLMLLFLGLDNVIEVEGFLGVDNRCRCRAFLTIVDLASLENQLSSFVY